ncbi:ABC transporter substrate-binding protein [Cohnella caldifontis]|uniref:ABC transporter substrate-binding protein n=1 Tax=Cohnella caldifontis TaxID=3027471 RepID=UPI0023EAD882|nr:sugar ABC transporter substrate-binding protein [Cohnella sp. YIM B05605]
MGGNKKLSLLLAGVLAVSVLAGCGSGGGKAAPNDGGSAGGTQSASQGSGSSQEQVILQYWNADDPSLQESKDAEKLIKEFESSHPNIKIEMQYISYEMLHDKLVTAINAGDAPDVSWGLPEWVGEFAAIDSLLDLTPYFDKWSDKDKIYPNVIDALKVNDKLVGMPNYLGIRALEYHEDMLKKAGISAPPKTWDELIAMGPKIKEAAGVDAFGITGTGVRVPQELIVYLAQNDLEIAEKMDDGKYKNTWNDDPEQLKRAAEVFQFYKDLADKGVIGSKTWGYQELDTNLALGQYAMSVNGAWQEQRAKENPDGMKDVKIAPIPYKLKPATYMEVVPYFIYKQTKHPEEAWEFLSFMMDKPYQDLIHPTNSARNDVVSDSQWGKDFMALSPTGVVFPPISLGGVTQAMIDSLARLYLKKDSPEDVAKWLSGAINDSLKKSGDLSSK